tara:strand:- start:5497 stop:5670 length:174 start_codon:yes stop_codon:yes gene_type:complete
MIKIYNYSGYDFQISKNLNDKYNVLDLQANDILKESFETKDDALHVIKLTIDITNNK